SDRKPADQPVKPTDAEFKLIAKALGHKTTLDDGPVVPAGGAALPPLPVPPPVPKVEIDLPAAPAAQPMPRLDAVPLPPALDIPRIPDPAPPAPEAKVVLNRREVSFDFQVTKVGPSKVKAVELWATRDAGQSWQKYDRRPGAQSPLNTHLGGEGEYGFKLVFESESGMRTPEPGPGTKADLQAELDLSPPAVQMRPFQAGPDGTVSIRWTMTDKNLATDRTRIEYSPDGRAWHVITRGQAVGPDERSVIGNYAFHWRMPGDLPHHLHVRVTAVDLAGNESAATLPQPSSIDLIVPEGKLTGVGTPRGTEAGPMPRVVRPIQVFSHWAEQPWFNGQ
ncbi:MAG TPA: hypothetical protein VM597_31355, partial [Gemmataceae bacterium]|nr:hypothetical protein [Gemmataceae bacterium]